MWLNLKTGRVHSSRKDEEEEEADASFAGLKLQNI